MTPDEIRDAYFALEESVRKSLNWELVKRNKSWSSARNQFKAHLEQNGSASLAEARELGIVPQKTTSASFVKCVVKPLQASGFTIVEQKGVLPRNAVLYHTPGNEGKADITKQVFEEPNREGALFVVNNLINGHTGRIDVSKLLTVDQFPFLNDTQSKRKFEVLLTDEAEKQNCAKTSKPFVFIREVIE